MVGFKFFFFVFYEANTENRKENAFHNKIVYILASFGSDIKNAKREDEKGDSMSGFSSKKSAQFHSIFLSFFEFAYLYIINPTEKR